MINGQLLGIVPGLGFQPQKKKKKMREKIFHSGPQNQREKWVCGITVSW